MTTNEASQLLFNLINIYGFLCTNHQNRLFLDCAEKVISYCSSLKHSQIIHYII